MKNIVLNLNLQLCLNQSSDEENSQKAIKECEQEDFLKNKLKKYKTFEKVCDACSHQVHKKHSDTELAYPLQKNTLTEQDIQQVIYSADIRRPISVLHSNRKSKACQLNADSLHTTQKQPECHSAQCNYEDKQCHHCLQELEVPSHAGCKFLNIHGYLCGDIITINLNIQGN